MTEVPEMRDGPGLGLLRPVAVEIDRADIKYRVYEEQYFGARERFARGLKGRSSIKVHAVKSLSLDFFVGEAVGIVGSNGSGKSTLLRAIAGLQSLESGSIRVRGEVGLLGVGAALKPKISALDCTELKQKSTMFSPSPDKEKPPSILSRKHTTTMSADRSPNEGGDSRMMRFALSPP